MASLGGAAARAKHVVVSGFEHPSVADAAKALAERGVEVTVVAPSASGVVSADAFAAAVRAGHGAGRLHAGCRTRSARCSRSTRSRARSRRGRRAATCTSTRCRRWASSPIDVADAAFDSLAISAHKIHGPKGAGALWLKKGARARPLVFGGGQERGLRPGTEGVPGIVALGVACTLAAEARAESARRMEAQRERLWTTIAAALPAARRNGEAASTAPHILSVGFGGVPAEPLLHALELYGVYVSAGSACHAKDKKPSATLRAIGVPDDVGVIRLSLSRFTTDAEVARAGEAVVTCVRKLAAS